MSDFKTLDDFEFDGKTVLVRADLNVPTKDGVVTDTTRIDRLAPTLTELSQAGAKVVVLSHFGRPKGGPDEKYSLKQVVDTVSKAVDQKVAFASDCVGPVAKEALAKIHPGAIILLENLRFHPEEEKNDPAFAAQLAELGDIYVNDAFSAAHRAHASTEGLARLLPNAAGRLMEAEIFHHDDGAGMDLRQGFRGNGADAVGSEGHLLTDRLGNGVHHLFQRILLIGAALGPAEMRQDDDLGAGLRKLGQSRSQTVNASRIRHNPVLGRDVQVGADQNRLAVELKIIKGFEVAHRCRPIPWFRA